MTDPMNQGVHESECERRRLEKLDDIPFDDQEPDWTMFECGCQFAPKEGEHEARWDPCTVHGAVMQLARGVYRAQEQAKRALVACDCETVCDRCEPAHEINDALRMATR